MKGLVIERQWIALILDGSKTWEMRSKANPYRGPVGLIPKGSKQVVAVAKLVGVRAPLTREELQDSFEFHRVPIDIFAGMQGGLKWNTPWLLGEVALLRRAVPYRHRRGWMSWFDLPDEVEAAVNAQMPARETC